MNKTFFFLVIFFAISYGAKSQNNYLKAKSYYDIEVYDSSVYYFAKAIDEDKSNHFSYLYRARSYIYLKEYKLALKDIEMAEQIEMEAYDFEMAICYAALGKAAVSVKYLRNHLSGSPKHFESEIKTTSEFLSIENSPEWIALWKETWYSPSEKLMEEAAYLVKTGKNFEAISFITNNLSNFASLQEAYFYRALAHKDLKIYKSAIKDLSRAIDLEPKAKYFQERGEVFLLMNKIKKAIPDFTYIIKKHKDETLVRLKRAEAYYFMEEYELAKKDILRYLLNVPFSEEGLFWAGTIFYAREEYIEALGYFNKLILAYPTQKKYFEGRADTYYKTGTYKFALEDYNTALDYDVYDANLYIKKGRVQQATGDVDAACENWLKARELGSIQADILLWDFCQKE